MPDWSSEIRKRLGGPRASIPPREASVVEEISQHLDDRYAELVARGAAPEAARRVRARGARGARPRRRAEGGAAPPRALAHASARGRRRAPAGRREGLPLRRAPPAPRARRSPSSRSCRSPSASAPTRPSSSSSTPCACAACRSRSPEELLNVRIEPNEGGRTGNFSGHWPQLTSLLWDGIRAEQKAFSKLAVWSSDRVNLASGGEARYADALWVSGTFFDTVGVRAAAGPRSSGPADDMPGCPSPAVVAERALLAARARRARARARRDDPVEGRRFEIAGVTPARFFGIEVGHAFDVALPTCAEDLLADSPRTAEAAPPGGSRRSAGSPPAGRSRRPTRTSPRSRRGSSRRRCPRTTTPRDVEESSSRLKLTAVPPRPASRTCARTIPTRCGCCSASPRSSC